MAEISFRFYGHYRITYIREMSSRIDILGVFHGALDFSKYLP